MDDLIEFTGPTTTGLHVTRPGYRIKEAAYTPEERMWCIIWEKA